MRTWPSFPAVVYRMYDADDTLVYVGSSSNLGKRLNDHEFAGYFPRVTHIRVNHYRNMAAALRAERRAFHEEKPEVNTNVPPSVASGMPIHFTTYQVLRDYVEEHEYAPSVDELRQLLGLKSTASVKARLDTLVSMGLIRRAGPRAIEFLDPSDG